MIYRNFFKRWIDVIGSGIGLVLLSPLLLITACLVKKNLGSPVIFSQERPGKNGKIFVMYKFRSMKEGEEDDIQRITPFGKELRATSIDELPELWNVFRGDMSLIGPRPLLVQYLPRYSSEQMRRHDVLPGITGLAQVNGRNSITWTEKFRFDLEYVDNYDFFMDVKILLLTFRKVFVKEGIVQCDEVTMEEFKGDEKNVD
ncbi:MAG: sugar transferase [Fusobacteriaceae bacterium]